MARWKYRLNLDDLFRAFDEGTMEAPDIGNEVAKRLRAIDFSDSFHNGERDYLADSFEFTPDAQEFDAVMNDLYDFADTVRLWISSYEGTLDEPPAPTRVCDGGSFGHVVTPSDG
jgi:hypothetical protein